RRRRWILVARCGLALVLGRAIRWFASMIHGTTCFVQLPHHESTRAASSAARDLGHARSAPDGFCPEGTKPCLLPAYHFAVCRSRRESSPSSLSIGTSPRSIERGRAVDHRFIEVEQLREADVEAVLLADQLHAGLAQSAIGIGIGQDPLRRLD